ncbi:MAG TPA: PEP-CTERM sorting domain-containing protein [Verrucomicrobiae bacterium]|nr:PEP-CTERM sorting domain-containing protein [Verrucomicrobiae bacterium]
MISFTAYAQGNIHFGNTLTTLISANGTPMPVSGTQQFIFAIFLAPSTTVSSTNIQATYSDPIWQNLGGYATNSSTAPGRIITRLSLDVGTPTGYVSGSTVDFIVRGWSANAGATWAEALATWNNGSPLVPMFIGSSTIGNDMVLSSPLVTPTPFGPSADQVPGFNMTLVPEPSALTLLGLGLTAIWRSRVSARR